MARPTISENPDPIETASIDKLRTLKLTRMRNTLEHAYNNSPFYKKKFDDCRVHPTYLETLSNLAKFPFTSKQKWKATIF